MDSRDKHDTRIYMSGMDTIHDNKYAELESLDSYRQHAIYFLCGKTIQRKYDQYFLRNILNNDEMLSLFIQDFIRADLYYDPNKKASKQTLRYIRGMWRLRQIRAYLSCRYNRKQILTINVQERQHRNQIETQIIKETKSPLDILMEKEKDEQIKTCIGISQMSDRDQSIIYLYHIDGYILEDIGRMYGISRERVRQILVQFSTTMKKIFANNPVLKDKWLEYLYA